MPTRTIVIARPLRWQRVRVAVAVGALLAVPVACSDDPKESTGGDPTSGTTGTPTETSSVEPATGPEVKRPRYTVRLPSGWQVDESRPSFSDNDMAAEPESDPAQGGLTVSSFDGLSVPSMKIRQSDLLELARGNYSPKMRRVADGEVAGDDALVASGPEGDPGSWARVYSVVHDDTLLYISISTAGDDAANEEAVAAVLATWEWQ